MVRLLVWVLVAMAMLGIFYKIMSRGGIHQEAYRDDYGHLRSATGAPGSAPASAAPASLGTDTSRPIAYGLSFAAGPRPAGAANLVHLDCHGDPAPADRPHRGSCNPYHGDTSCRVVLPIACYRSSGATLPAGLEQVGWTHGQLAATEPVMGAILKSEPAASARCEAELGPGWRMAEFHDGGGWSLRGEGRSALSPNTRYWVYVNDQHGNCWDSKP